MAAASLFRVSFSPSPSRFDLSWFTRFEFTADERWQMAHDPRRCCQVIQQRATCRLFPAGVGADLPDVEECAGRVASPGQ